LDSLPDMLHRGDGDIIAHGLTVTQERQKTLAFTHPHITTYQVLVQRKPDNWRDMKLHEINEQLVRNPLELAGKTVHVRRNSSYYQRLLNLEEEIGADIDIVAVSGDHETEELIRMVADGEIDYTVSDHNIASINKTYYTNIDIRTQLSFPQKIAWAVRKSSPLLLDTVNAWIDSMKETTDYYVIYNKYFENRKAFRRRQKSEFFSRTGNRISQYDSLIQTYADSIGWDWRLLAAMVYQESQFDPEAESWAGARGLMQMMPSTAAEFGVTDPLDPTSSIKAGSRYIRYLKELYEDVPDTVQRQMFVMASYNVGENHVADARRLAEKYGDDPSIWEDNVDKYILLKSDPDYFNDEVVRYGYCRGEEPYNYVREILARYRHYTRFISADQVSSDDDS
ncbi:transporter substrate-binding domain-containing protein, partial [candidate division GN15 bacterium]|nr:transporter substrate-binding domain-containing protein [candidate division GN15 bacterium]